MESIFSIHFFSCVAADSGIMKLVSLKALFQHRAHSPVHISQENQFILGITVLNIGGKGKSLVSCQGFMATNSHSRTDKVGIV